MTVPAAPPAAPSPTAAGRPRPGRVVLPGGSGQVGRVLARHFAAAGADVVILTRSPGDGARDGDGDGASPGHPGRRVRWDGRTVADAWAAELDGAACVVNLAGRSVNCRYHAKNRAAITDSRLDSTRAVGEALARCSSPPPVWLQSSTATIYPHTPEGPANGEDAAVEAAESDPDTWRFSFGVARDWEAAANAYRDRLPGTRVVLMRSAMVMSPDPGGVFDVLLGLVKARLGGRQGDGRQFVSWVHDADFCAALDRLADDDSFAGPVNLAAPNPLPNAEFMKALREAAGVRFGLPATAAMVEIGAVFMRTESELVLKSRKVVPKALLDAGFTFRFPNWPAAAADLVRRHGERT